MTTTIAEEVLNDPIVLAIAVFVDRLGGLPKEDRHDMLALVEALETAETEEERDAVARGIREIMRQQKGGVQPMNLPGQPAR